MSTESPVIIEKLWSWGGKSLHHDFLMSDGSIQTIEHFEAIERRKRENAAKREKHVGFPRRRDRFSSRWPSHVRH